MLKAKMKGKLFYSWRDNPASLIALSHERKLRCPSCETIAIFVNSKIRIRHFKHLPNIDCPNDGEHNPIHDKMEIKMEQLLRRAGYNTDVEKMFNFENHKRVADVYGVHPETGHEVVIEVQYKNVNVDVVKKTRDFNSKGIDTIWVFYDSDPEDLDEFKPKRDLLLYAMSISSLCFLYNDSENTIDVYRIFATYYKKKLRSGAWVKTPKFKWSLKSITSVPFSEFISYWKDLKKK